MCINRIINFMLMRESTYSRYYVGHVYGLSEVVPPNARMLPKLEILRSPPVGGKLFGKAVRHCYVNKQIFASTSFRSDV